ncbi:MAG: hypothetical protein DME60_09605 [Verrucomicrobia bacterium]|nr:MAG: hypothetical protein DME60_09605 [Verrucomicrobiota bacterium]
MAKLHLSLRRTSVNPPNQPNATKVPQNMKTRSATILATIITALIAFTSACDALAQGTWETKTSMPSNHYSFGTGVVNGIIYAVGGINNQSMNVGTMEAYDPVINTWMPKAPMPTTRHALGVGVVNGTLYAVGGASEVNGCGDLNVVEAYDPATNMWTTKAPMTTAQSHLAVGVVNGILYAVGGITGNIPSCNNGYVVGTLQAYNPATDMWTTKAPMPTARSEVTVGVVNGILYAVGGNNPPVSTVEAYDPASDTWTTKAHMPTPRYAAGGGVVNGILYVAGGSNGTTGALTTVEAYDPIANSWTEIAPMPTPRYGLSDSVVNNVLYALGGANATGVLATNEAFTPPCEADTWTTIAPMPAGVLQSSGVACGGNFYVIDGYGSGSPQNVPPQVYDPVSNS